MTHRIFSTALLWGVVIGALSFLGNPAGAWILAIMGLLAQYELHRLLEKLGYRPLRTLGLIAGVAIILGSYYLPHWSGLIDMDAGTDIFLVSILILLATAPFSKSEDHLRASTIPTLFSLLFIPFMLQLYVSLASNFSEVGEERTGLLLSIWLIVVAKFTDVGGLLIGTTIGKHKLAPKVSPKKTWEGTIGGILFAVISGMIFYHFTQAWLPQEFTLWAAAMMAVPIACTTIISDLVESVLKRQANIKDSGNCIPGIGGALDLVDSLLLSAPVGYLLMKYTLL